MIMGWGPNALRRRATDRESSSAPRCNEFQGDPLLRAIGAIGPGVLTAHPRFADLADSAVHEHLRRLLEDVRPHRGRRGARPAHRRDHDDAAWRAPAVSS